MAVITCCAHGCTAFCPERACTQFHSTCPSIHAATPQISRRVLRTGVCGVGVGHALAAPRTHAPCGEALQRESSALFIGRHACRSFTLACHCAVCRGPFGSHSWLFVTVSVGAPDDVTWEHWTGARNHTPHQTIAFCTNTDVATHAHLIVFHDFNRTWPISLLKKPGDHVWVSGCSRFHCECSRLQT